MKIASISENKNIEKRVAITPETTKKYLSEGFEVLISKNYGDHLGFSDNEYKELGANIINDENKIIQDSDILVQLGLPSDEKLKSLKDNQNLIGVLNPFNNKEKINDLIKKKLRIFP